ncbi:hypothetical protein AA0114_g8015 [Alternaria tenuissima]|uniref:Major facilitator superfamily (MFS) profile domain-containing protein n=1 Tax=Alternaria tenuissima TaxID=119927 RepID=A0A4Q4MAI8_9PLEO|nr:hypothetical protein AA0114_g8015 [Alternaria tenuissima]
MRAVDCANTVGNRRLATNRVRSTGARQTIDNPFLTFDDTKADLNTGRTELEEYVWQFAALADLKDRYELLRFGARLARDKFETISRYADELTGREKKLLEQEKDKSTGFWKQSKFLRATIMTASLAGMIQGWTQSVNNGTAYGMPDEFKLCVRRNHGCPSSDLWTFGMLNAVPLLSAGLFGTLLADPLQENFLGRRGSVMLSCAITIASTIVPIYAAEISPEHIRGAILANWQLADAAGIFLGFLANLLVVVYVKDSASAWRILTNTVLIPTIPLLVMIYLMPESPRYLMKHGNYRKALEAFEQVQTTQLLASRDFMYAHAQLDFESRLLKGKVNQLGNLAERVDISTSSFASEPSLITPDRVQLETVVSQAPIPPGGLIQGSNTEATNGGTTIEPGNSQHQHRSHTEQNENTNIELAVLNRRWSDVTSLNLDTEVKRAKKKSNPYSYNIGVNGYYKRLRELWSNKRCRRALLSASVSMITQTLTGVNTIAFLGTIIWNNAITDNSDQIAAIIGLAFGAANYVFGLPAYWSSDRLGRSIMLLLGLPNMAWSILVFAFLFKISESESVRTPLISIFAVIFVAFYAPTAGTSPFSIAAEVFPLVSREAGMAVSVAINLSGAGILVLVFPFLLNSIGPTAAFSIFAGLNLVAFVLVYLFVPETRMRTLEELQYTFDLPTGWHVAYRLGYIRRHVWENWWKYLARKEVDPPIAFYAWARETYREMEGAS